MKTIIDQNKKRFHGNLHCHTTRSDGESTVAEIAAGYYKEGYQFVAITDHRKVFHQLDFNKDDFILISGMEIDTWVEPNKDHRFFHFQVIGALEHDHYEDTKIFTDYDQSMLPFQEYQGYLKILNHPHWSRMTVDQIKKANPKFMEIYNHSAEVENGCGYNLEAWDELLHSGYRVLGIAADDNHMKIDEKNITPDYYGGVTTVLSDELSQSEIIKNIEEGNFYTKQGIKGPDFIQVTKEQNVVQVWCTKVVKLSFIAFNYHGEVFHDKSGNIEYGSFTAKGHKFVRIELEDMEGRKAWSNPIYFE